MEYIPHFVDELISVLTDLHINNSDNTKNTKEVKNNE